MPDVEIEISVDKEYIDLDLDLGPEDEGLVFRVHTGARPCMRCLLNAQSTKPQAPPLHAHCKCSGRWEKSNGSIIDALR